MLFVWSLNSHAVAKQYKTMQKGISKVDDHPPMTSHNQSKRR